MNLHLKLFDDLMARLGWRLPVLVVWTALVGLSEGVSVILLLPLLSRVGVAAGSSQGLVTGLVYRSLAFIGAREPLPILAVIVVITGLQGAASSKCSLPSCARNGASSLRARPAR
jgi:hypothetical protein